MSHAWVHKKAGMVLWQGLSPRPSGFLTPLACLSEGKVSSQCGH
jgi:hypothetical protein